MGIFKRKIFLLLLHDRGSILIFVQAYNSVVQLELFLIDEIDVNCITKIQGFLAF